MKASELLLKPHLREINNETLKNLRMTALEWTIKDGFILNLRFTLNDHSPSPNFNKVLIY